MPSSGVEVGGAGGQLDHTRPGLGAGESAQLGARRGHPGRRVRPAAGGRGHDHRHRPDLDLLAAADHLIDMGPGGGPDGGHILAAGNARRRRAYPPNVRALPRGRSRSRGTERLPCGARRAGATAATGGPRWRASRPRPRSARGGCRSTPCSASRRSSSGPGYRRRRRPAGSSRSGPCQARSTFGSPEVRSRHGCQGAPGPGTSTDVQRRQAPRSHSGVGLAEPGDITGRSVRRPRPQGHWPLARRIGVPASVQGSRPSSHCVARASTPTGGSQRASGAGPLAGSSGPGAADVEARRDSWPYK
jgi:hypothetical protein